MQPFFVDENGVPLVEDKPTRQEPEVKISPMERLRREAEKEAAKQSTKVKETK